MEFPLFQTLRIEDEDELRRLLDFFLFHGHQVGSPGEIPRIPGWIIGKFCIQHFSLQDIPGENPTDAAQEQGNGRSQFQRDESQSLESSVPAHSVQVDKVLNILTEFLQDFPKLRWE